MLPLETFAAGVPSLLRFSVAGAVTGPGFSVENPSPNQFIFSGITGNLRCGPMGKFDVSRLPILYSLAITLAVQLMDLPAAMHSGVGNADLGRVGRLPRVKMVSSLPMSGMVTRAAPPSLQ